MVTMRVVLQQLLEYCARPLSQTPRLVPDCAHRRQGRRQLQHPLLSPGAHRCGVWEFRTLLRSCLAFNVAWPNQPASAVRSQPPWLQPP